MRASVRKGASMTGVGASESGYPKRGGGPTRPSSGRHVRTSGWRDACGQRARVRKRGRWRETGRGSGKQCVGLGDRDALDPDLADARQRSGHHGLSRQWCRAWLTPNASCGLNTLALTTACSHPNTCRRPGPVPAPVLQRARGPNACLNPPSGNRSRRNALLSLMGQTHSWLEQLSNPG